MSYSEFARFYRTLALARDHFSIQADIIKSIIQDYFFSNDLKILDAAAGTGDMLDILYKSGFKNITANDGSIEMLSFVSNELKKNTVLSNYKWLQLNKLFKKDGKFDLICIIGNSLAHSSIIDTQKILEIIHEGLKENGLFVFDLRNWHKDSNGKLIEPNRKEGVFRNLGEVKIPNGSFRVEDNVSYNRDIQNITYRIRKVGKNMRDSASETTINLRYHMFTQKEVYLALERAGFETHHIKVRNFEGYPYTLFVCQKSK